MKQFLLATYCLICLSSLGQNLGKQLKKIHTVEEANTFIKSTPNVEGELLTINSAIDSNELSKKILALKKGQTFSEANYIYKLIEIKTIPSFRASYIYLDGNKVSKKSIDSLRSIIISKYNNGTSFIDLVKEYNMDSNPNGDLGWFTEGAMVKEFEMEVRKHKLNDIFTIDIPSNKWYYVTLKTFETRNTKKLIVLKIKSNT